MVRITDKNDRFLLYFPKHLNVDAETHTLLLLSQSSLEKYSYTFEDLDSLNNFYVMDYNKTFEDLSDGEYNYYIDDDKAIGILAIGKYYTTQDSTVEVVNYSGNDEDKYIYYEG